MIRLLLIADHAAFRQPLAVMMDNEPDIEVVGQAGTVAEARQMLRSLPAPVDVALVDLELPDGTGLDVLRDVRAASPVCALLIVTAVSSRVQIARAVEAGATGVIHKTSGIAEIINAVRRCHMGEQLFSPSQIIEMLRLLGEQRDLNRNAHAALARLTKREREVLQALADGLNDKEITERLHISTEIARTHMVNILGKLGVDSRLQALVFAVRHGATEIRQQRTIINICTARRSITGRIRIDHAETYPLHVFSNSYTAAPERIPPAVAPPSARSP